MLDSLKQQIINQEYWKRFIEIGLPTKKTESFRYVKLKALYERVFETAQPINPLITPKQDEMVFVNGRYDPFASLPSKELIVQPLSEAKKSYGAFLTPRLKSQLKAEHDPFAALNGALCEEPIFIYLPPKSVSSLKIIHHIIPQNASVAMHPRCHLYAGRGAQSKIVIAHQAYGWVNSYMDIALDEGASIVLNTFLEENEKSWHFDAVRATLKRNSHFKNCLVAKGGETLRRDYVIRLMEEGSEAGLYGLSCLDGRSHHHIHVLMEHQSPRCRSLQHFKNVLRGVSQTSFEGKIYIDQNAQQSEAFQVNNNLILSEHASAQSKPNLEIFADDVKASHGSTIGQIDEEHLFYLKTRGISHSQAKELLVEGFCQEILDLL
ncbi:MAG: Fe-S cluster assembly protein SufD [Chlamydiales bacterium]